MSDFKVKISKSLSFWQAGSAHAEDFPDLTIDNAQGYPEALTKLLYKFGDKPNYIKATDFKEDSFELIGDIFNKHGSDKSSSHNYHLPYSCVAESLGLDSEIRVLEVGIGTNQAGFVSTMGKNGKPGASLRAWREIFSNSQVFGADLDESILFEEQRIKTYAVDQMKPESFDVLFEKCGSKKFNLIIDDGLHSPLANLNTLHFGLSQVELNGWVVIEDILPRHIHTLLPIDQILRDSSNYKTYIIQTRRTYMYLVQKVLEA